MSFSLQTVQAAHLLHSIRNIRYSSGQFSPFSGCGAPGTRGPVSSPSTSGSNPYTSFFVALAIVTAVLLIGCLTASLIGSRAQLSRAAHLRVYLSAVAISIVALLGLAWGWQLNSTYNDGGCVVYVQTAPIASDFANNFAAILFLGVSAAALVFLMLCIVLGVRSLRVRQRMSTVG